jgi:hypothetical protein
VIVVINWGGFLQPVIRLAVMQNMDGSPVID